MWTRESLQDARVVDLKISAQQQISFVVQALELMHLHSVFIRQVLRSIWNLQEMESWQIFLKQVRLLRLHSADHVLVQEIHLQTMRSASVIPPETSRIVKAQKFKTDRYRLLLSWMRVLLPLRQQTKVSLQGTYLNEYLISQPLYELTQGYIPLLFWQFVPPVSTIDRIKRDIQKVVDTYEKGVLLENKTVHVNARIGKEELVQELKKRGFRFVTKRIDKVEELWNLSDGINSPCEEVVQNIVEQIGVRRYKELCENALYLDLDDLKQLVEDVQGLIFQSL